MKVTRTRIILIAVGALIVVSIVVAFFRPSSDSDLSELPLTTLLSEAKAGAIERIEVHDDDLKVFRKDGMVYKSRKERDISIISVLASSGADPATITIEVKEFSPFGSAIGLLFGFVPIILFFGVIFYAIYKLGSRR